MSRNLNRRSIVLFAAASTVAGIAHAGVTGGTGQVYPVYTTGATALGNFTSAVGNKGPYLVGASGLQIGASTYTVDTILGQAFAQTVSGSPVTGEPPSTADRIAYFYHSTGSVNGIREVARAQGLLAVSPFR
jgi:copper oxidase (laccase) domain-containing protein